MGFLKKIFKKKKGGTKLGNLIRGVAKKVSGGKIGTGKHMIPKDQPINPDQTANQKEDLMVKIGGVVGNTANELLTPVISKALGGEEKTSSNLLTSVTDPIAESFTESFTNTVKKRWYIPFLIIVPFGLIIYGIYATRKKTNRRRYY